MKDSLKDELRVYSYNVFRELVGKLPKKCDQISFVNIIMDLIIHDVDEWVTDYLDPKTGSVLPTGFIQVLQSKTSFCREGNWILFVLTVNGTLNDIQIKKVVHILKSQELVAPFYPNKIGVLCELEVENRLKVENRLRSVNVAEVQWASVTEGNMPAIMGLLGSEACCERAAVLKPSP